MLAAHAAAPNQLDPLPGSLIRFLGCPTGFSHNFDADLSPSWIAVRECTVPAEWELGTGQRCDPS